MQKPIIGVTKPKNKDLFAFLAICAGVKLAGGDIDVITPSQNDYQSKNINGLILGGGGDIFPGRYMGQAKPEYIYDEARDEMEIFWAERARDEKIPTLGICRGAQLMNVVCGGTLHADVSVEYEGANYPDGIIHHTFFRKSINIRNGSLLNKITGKSVLRVNSIHKQAIAKLGKDININAQESNGVIQAISLDDHPFFLGVQFHPEFLIYRHDFRKIFEMLVKNSADLLKN